MQTNQVEKFFPINRLPEIEETKPVAMSVVEGFNIIRSVQDPKLFNVVAVNFMDEPMFVYAADQEFEAAVAIRVEAYDEFGFEMHEFGEYK